jgi:hypothetical protein
MRRRGWMCCSRTGEMVACGGRVEERCGWIVDDLIACCGSGEVGFCGIWAAGGGVRESDVGRTEVSGLLTGREGGAV